MEGRRQAAAGDGVGWCWSIVVLGPISLAPALPLRRSATFLPSPYVDAHGEEDPRLQRGK